MDSGMELRSDGVMVHVKGKMRAILKVKYLVRINELPMVLAKGLKTECRMVSD